ncbi:HsdM family class I SAM-dependent methyltransferase [Nocardioides bizhenqiangii]|uniref:N-6 DNA methylase n=1 Tax=Nocardioides bizhenqiangii TaxID=3095076 RepID=A0ABZ0ZRA6_9ACTN|nr:N-6 DNA methylase [Nocardioides sp. HM61]WQQ26825.1 N-6 DNA methylase [Nocardioides sp. HM61]
MTAEGLFTVLLSHYGTSASEQETLQVKGIAEALVAADLASSDREIALAERFDQLHTMLYMRGGIRPTNAAVEELAKLLLLRVWLAREPNAFVQGVGRLSDLLELSDPADVYLDGVKAAFRQAIAEPDLAASLPDGTTQTVWPLDEPLRIGRADVLAEALSVLAEAVPMESKSAPGDILGSAFDIFLRGRYDHAGGLATYLTPTVVTSAAADIALSLVDPWSFKGMSFGDPCSGTGRFLVALLDRLKTFYGDSARGKAKFQEMLSAGVFGADQSASSIAKARVNLLLYGAHHPRLFTVEDSVTDPALDKMRDTLSLILTNPPFGEGKYDSVEGIRRTEEDLSSMSGGARRIDPALAFVARCANLLRPGGVLGIVLPDGLVDGPVLREELFGASSRGSQLTVEASISLPTATFALSGTVARTSLLFLRKGESTSERIFLARAEHIGYLKQSGRAVPDPKGSDLPLIVASGIDALVTKARTRTPLVASEAPLIAAIPRQDVTSLDPAAWDPGSMKARKELKSSGASMAVYLAPQSRRRLARAADEVSAFVSVLHVDPFGSVAWHEAASYAPATPGQTATAGQVLVSLLNPSKLRAFVVPDAFPLIECSMEFGVFDALDVDPYYVLALLHDPRVKSQLAPLGRGTSSSRRRITSADVLGLRVPKASMRAVASVGRETRERIEAIRISQSGLAAIYESQRPVTARTIRP